MWKHWTAVAAAALVGMGAASAHTVTFGWTDNGDGTVKLWNEHWHGDQPFPCNEGVQCSANGGLTISGDGTNNAGSYGQNAYTVQWAGTLNNTDRDVMKSDGTLTGYQDDPGNPGGGTEDDWLYTANLVLGDGYWWFFTGTNCCIDTMTQPVLIHLTGIGSVDPGTGPGSVSAVPLPAAGWMLLSGLGAFGLARRRGQQPQQPQQPALALAG